MWLLTILPYMQQAAADTGRPDPLFAEQPRDPGEEPVPVRWLNYYASADPVPNGPLFDEAGDSARPEWMTEVEVWNHASVLTDHTTYTGAQDGFLGLLAVALLETPARSGTTHEWHQALEHALWRRWWRVWWLATMRFLAIVGAIAGILSIMLRGHLEDVGNLLAFVHDGVHYGSVPLRHALGVGTDVLGDATLAGATLVSVVVLAGYLLLVWVWRQWEARDLDGFFTRGDPTPAPLGGLPFAALVTLLGFVSTLTGFVVAYGNYPTSWADLARNWLWSLLALPIGAAAMYLVLRKAAAIDVWAREKFPIPRRKRHGAEEAPALVPPAV